MEPQREPEKTEPQSTGGLYKNVKIGTRALDALIVALLAVVVIVTLIGLRDPGFVIRFDARGGSDVESMKLQYGEVIPLPEPPTREGYEFTGWYMDENGEIPWDFASMTVNDNVVLYAGWEAKK